MTTTLTALKDRYSVLMTLAQLAEMLNRSPEGLRISLANPRASWALQINSAKIHIGRRVYFRTEAIARLIDEEFSGPSQ